MKRKKKLTESDWVMVFKLRCRSKRGEQLSEDEKRYSDMEKDVFNVTVLFGSSVRR